MQRVHLLFLLVPVACAACGSSTGQQGATIVAAAPARQTDPEQDRFARTYLLLFCRANGGYDRDASYTALKEPLLYMHLLEKVGSEHLAGYLNLLRENGYQSLEEFDRRAAAARKDEAFWSDLQQRALDGLGACHETGP